MKRFNNRKKITKEKIENYNFKEVALTKMAKRQLFITLFSILGVTIISLGSAYAIFTSVSKSAEYNVIKVGTLNIDFGDASNTIDLNGKYPMSDEEGLKLEPYKFTIQNTGSLKADYEVFIQDDTDMINNDNCANNQLNKDYIRYKLDTGTPANLSSIAGSNYKIATGTLEPGGSVTYTLYVWIREGVGNDVLNKHYHGKIVVNGVNSNGTNAVALVKSKSNEESLDYATATASQQKEAWVHSHPATEQTEALTDYRYIGADPNNYVEFNDELWRIIGVFTVDDGTGKVEERLKIIRNESIGSYSWDNKDTTTGAEAAYGKNNWTDARLNYLLNPGHESETADGSLYWNSSSGTCYSGSGNAAKNCDFTTTGLDSDARDMIGDTLWYLGGTSSYSSASNGLASHWYTYERGTNVYNSSTSPRDTSWVGKVGLMYPSDYGYATSGGSTTDRNTCLNKELYNWDSSSFSDCKNNDWLYESSYIQWTLSPSASSSGSVFYVIATGYVHCYNAYNSDGVRPVAFLKSNIKIEDGDGSSSNPYILME